MQKFLEADGGNPDGTAKDGVIGGVAGTKYKAKVWNDNFFNIFDFVESRGYSLIDDDLEQFTKAMHGKYNAAYTYNTSSIATQTVNDIVEGSDGLFYEAQANAINGDDPVGSITGNWADYNFTFKSPILTGAPTINGDAIPTVSNTSIKLIRSGSVVITTTASGAGTIVFDTAFPNAMVTALAVNGSSGIRADINVSITEPYGTSGVNVFVTDSSGTGVASTILRINYIALGN